MLSTAIERAAIPITVWAPSSSLRRSSTSARAPAWRARNSRGRVVVADIAATHKVDPVSSSISQPAATDCRKDPMFDTTEAIHSARN